LITTNCPGEGSPVTRSAEVTTTVVVDAEAIDGMATLRANTRAVPAPAAMVLRMKVLLSDRLVIEMPPIALLH